MKLDGERLEGKGVAPDIVVEDKLGPDDPILQRALSYLSTQLTKPGVSGQNVKAKSH